MSPKKGEWFRIIKKKILCTFNRVVWKASRRQLCIIIPRKSRSNEELFSAYSLVLHATSSVEEVWMKLQGMHDTDKERPRSLAVHAHVTDVWVKGVNGKAKGRSKCACTQTAALCRWIKAMENYVHNFLTHQTYMQTFYKSMMQSQQQTFK